MGGRRVGGKRYGREVTASRVAKRNSEHKKIPLRRQLTIAIALQVGGGGVRSGKQESLRREEVGSRRWEVGGGRWEVGGRR